MQDNDPSLWLAHFPWPKAEGHKYDRGHAVILGGPVRSTGAAKLAARAALRVGAGLVSIACPPSALATYAAALQAVMTKPVKDRAEFVELIEDPHVRAVLLGPGAGVTKETRDVVMAALQSRKPCVLDADALSVFSDQPADLFCMIRAPCILTPHAGEFGRLFKMDESLEVAVSEAAYFSGTVVVLKGAKTWIGAPNGRLVRNTHATPFLATAGTGDVLAGLCTGLVAQGMPAFEAACAAVWLHGEASRRFGPGLIAEDLSEAMPAVLAALHAR